MKRYLDREIVLLILIRIKGGKNKISMFTNYAKWLLIILTLLTFGCAKTYQPENIYFDSTSSKKIPLRVGLVVTREYRNLTVPLIVYDRSATGDRVELGEVMTKGAVLAFDRTFDELVVIDSSDWTTISQTNIQVISRPELVRAVLIENVPFYSRYQIAIKWMISQPDGKVVYTNTVMGEGIARTGATRIEQSMTNALKDHYEKLTADLVSANWWENIR